MRSGSGADATPSSSHDRQARFSRLVTSTKYFAGRSQFWRLVRKYAKAAGIPEHKAHPHVLKHSIAMQTIGSAGIENVRQYLGHKSISSTGAYLRVTDADASSAVTGAVGRRRV